MVRSLSSSNGKMRVRIPPLLQMRFRLRTLLLLMIPLGGLFLGLNWLHDSVQRSKEYYRQKADFDKVDAKIRAMGRYLNAHDYRVDQIYFVNFCSACSITDEDLRFLKKLTGLKELSFDCAPSCPAKITDAGLEHLKSMKHLRHILISQATCVTKEGVENLRKALPNTTVQASATGEY